MKTLKATHLEIDGRLGRVEQATDLIPGLAAKTQRLQLQIDDLRAQVAQLNIILEAIVKEQQK